MYEKLESKIKQVPEVIAAMLRTGRLTLIEKMLEDEAVHETAASLPEYARFKKRQNEAKERHEQKIAAKEQARAVRAALIADTVSAAAGDE